MNEIDEIINKSLLKVLKVFFVLLLFVGGGTLLLYSINMFEPFGRIGLGLFISILGAISILGFGHAK